MRTREESRLYMREYRARKRAETAAVSCGGDSTTTDVQDAVRAELAPLPTTVTRPGLTAAAMAMAKILDDPKAGPHHASAARSLGDILARLHSSRDHSGGKLAALRASRDE
jgi:hypothetical protein